MELSISLVEVGLDRSVRKVEFGGGIEVILQQSRVFLHNLQYQESITLKQRSVQLPAIKIGGGGLPRNQK